MTTRPEPGSADRYALREGFSIGEIFNLARIDRWFLVQIEEIVDPEEGLAGAKNQVYGKI